MKLLQLFRRVLGAEYVSLEETAASFRLERKGETLFMLFEKSNGATDWKNNLDFPAKPYRRMDRLWFVHRGFMRVFRSIEPRIEARVSDERVKKIIVAGYSHGAALALLAYEYCVFHRPDLGGAIHGYGFGCPRVIWGVMGRELKERFRHFLVIRDGKDLVTHLPPALFGYRHAGNLLEIGRWNGKNAIDAHREESYLAALEEALA